ncbi:MAG: hypothetical protein R3B84_22170 [Zavarzinella sp.]
MVQQLRLSTHLWCMVLLSFLGSSLQLLAQQPVTPKSGEKQPEVTPSADLERENEELRNRLQQLAPFAPRAVEIDARIVKVGLVEIVRGKLTYRLKNQPKSRLMVLGLRDLEPTALRLDGKALPDMVFTKEGLTVDVGPPGEHTVEVEFESQLAAPNPGGEQVFRLDLPGALITLLQFDGPKEISRLQLQRTIKKAISGSNSFTKESEEVDRSRFQAGGPGIPLGQVYQLEVRWIRPGKQQPEPRRADVSSRVTVQTKEILLETRYELSGSVRDWVFRAPANADVVVEKVEPVRLTAVRTALPTPQLVRPERGKNEWRAEWAEPQDAILTVKATYRISRSNQKTQQIILGPWGVRQAISLTGQLVVDHPASLRSRYKVPEEMKKLSSDNPLQDRYSFAERADKPLEEGLTATLWLDETPGSLLSELDHQFQFFVGDAWKFSFVATIYPQYRTVEKVDLLLPNEYQVERISHNSTDAEWTTAKASNGETAYSVALQVPEARKFTITITGKWKNPKSETNQFAVDRFPSLREGTTIEEKVTLVLPEYKKATSQLLEKVEGVEKSQQLTCGKIENGLRRYSGFRTRSSAQLVATLRDAMDDVQSRIHYRVTLLEKSARVEADLTLVNNTIETGRLELLHTMGATGFRTTNGSMVQQQEKWYLLLDGNQTDANITLIYDVELAESDSQRIPLVHPTNTISRTAEVWLKNSRQSSYSLVSEDCTELPPITRPDSGEFLPTYTLLVPNNVPEITFQRVQAESATQAEVVVEKSLLEVEHTSKEISCRNRLLIKYLSETKLSLRINVSTQNIQLWLNQTSLGASSKVFDANTTIVELPPFKAGTTFVLEARYTYPLNAPRHEIAPLVPLNPHKILISRWVVHPPADGAVLVYSPANLDLGIRNLKEPLGSGVHPTMLDDWFTNDAPIRKRLITNHTYLSGTFQQPMELSYVVVNKFVVVFAALGIVMFTGMLLLAKRRSAFILGVCVCILLVGVGIAYPIFLIQFIQTGWIGVLGILLLLFSKLFLNWRRTYILRRLSGFRADRPRPRDHSSTSVPMSGSRA